MSDLMTPPVKLIASAPTSASREDVTTAVGDEKGKCLAVSWLKNSLALAFL